MNYRKKLERLLEKMGVKVAVRTAIDETETLEIGTLTFRGKKFILHTPPGRHRPAKKTPEKAPLKAVDE